MSSSSVPLDTSLDFSNDPEEIDTEGKVQDVFPQSPIHYNLRTLSYSGILTLHSCPRKFELYRLLPRADEDDTAGHLAFGTVVGNGIQEYIVTSDLNKAILRVFLDWKDNLDSESGAKSAKTFWHAVWAVEKFVGFYAQELSNYEVAVFNGKPAVELGFDIDCGNGFRLRGKLDALLIHKVKREFLVIECKTTGLSNVSEAMYKNSAQAVGYGVVVDAVAHQSAAVSNSYSVLYPVYKTKAQEWEPFRFPKSYAQRALWIQSILYDIAHIEQYHEMEFFPQHGESCLSFNRACQFFGLCHLSNKHLVGKLSKVKIRLDGLEEFPLRFSLGELVDAQVARGLDLADSNGEQEEGDE